MNKLEVFKYLVAGGFWTLAILFFVFLYPDKVEHWMRLFYTALRFLSSSFPNLKRWIDYRYVAVSIQDAVNRVSDKVNQESPNCLPHPLKIEWVNTDTPESFIAKGKTVVRLKHTTNQDRNIVESTLIYLKQGFLPRAKHYLDKTLRQSAEYKVAIQIFMARRDTGAYDYFLDNTYYPVQWIRCLVLKCESTMEKSFF